MIHISAVRDRNRRTSLGQVSGGVAIHDAVVKGKLHLAKFILDAVDSHTVVNSRDAHGKTPLIRAIRIEEEGVRIRVVDLLVKYHADVNLVDNVGRTALSYACELHRNDIIRKLVKNNVDPNLQDKNGNTPLMYCAITGNATGIEILSKSFRRLGLDVDMVNADGMTPLMVAAKSGFAECAQLLAHEAKASVYRRDNVHNMNAIEWAREGGCSSPDVEALQPRSRAHSKSAVNLSSNDQNENIVQDHNHQERMQPNREPVSPISPAKGLTSSLPHIDSYFGKESHHKNMGSQPDIRSLHNDKRRFHQLNLGELSQKFQGLNAGLPHDNLPSCSHGNTPSPETPDKTALIKDWESHESSLIDSQSRLVTKSIPDDLNKPYEKTHLQEPFQAPIRPSSAIGLFNKRAQQPVGNQRRRPLSANVTNRHSNRQSKSFDSALTLTTTRPSNSIENLTLTLTQPPIVPHPPVTAKEDANLCKLSHLSRSTEVLSQGRPSFEQHNGASRNSVIDCMNLHGISGKTKRERNASLSPGDLSGFLTRTDSGPNSQQFDHLPSLSPSSTSH